MATVTGWTSADLELLPDREGWRYEIIDGELLVSKLPHAFHQAVCAEVGAALVNWNQDAALGIVLIAPGLVFAQDQDVAPDVAWASHRLLTEAMDAAGHLTSAPELVVEVLSPGAANERRDRELKLNLYSRQGVQEYWLFNWRLRKVQIFKREGGILRLATTLGDGDILVSDVLPGFNYEVSRFWRTLPPLEPTGSARTE
jgi:Uma2 family endonuclease